MNLFAAYTKNHLGKEIPEPAKEEEIRQELDGLLQQNVSTAKKEGKAKDGDIVNIDFEGFLNGVAFEGGKGENYDLELGSHTFIPGFEEALIGHEAEENVDVNVTFPADYQAKELAGKPVVFKCKIHEVKTKVENKLDDDFAKKLGFNSLEDLRKAVKEHIEMDKKAKVDNDYLEKLIRYLVSKSTIDVTPEAVKKSRERILESYQSTLMRYGIGLDDYLRALGMTREAFDAAIDGEAKNTAKTDVLTDYIANRENLQASEEDIHNRLEDLKKYYHLTDEKAKELLEQEKDEIALDCTREKVASFLLANND